MHQHISGKFCTKMKIWTAHKGFDLTLFKSQGIFSATWTGGGSSPGSIIGHLDGPRVLIVSPMSFLK